MPYRNSLGIRGRLKMAFCTGDPEPLAIWLGLFALTRAFGLLTSMIQVTVNTTGIIGREWWGWAFLATGLWICASVLLPMPKALRRVPYLLDSSLWLASAVVILYSATTPPPVLGFFVLSAAGAWCYLRAGHAP